MREYEMEVLEKYELEVNSTRRIRGAFYCDTKEGTMLLKETKISERRVPLLYLILNRLEKQGYLVDTPVFSKEGNLVQNSRKKQKMGMDTKILKFRNGILPVMSEK